MDKKPAVWLFAGGAMQRSLAEQINARNLALILTDGSEECACAPLADVFVHLDTFAIEENIARGQALKEEYDIRAVVTAAADCHETVARVAQSLGLAGIDPDIAHICRYKYETRELLTKAGVPQPKFTVAKSLEEALQALKAIGTPAALKATNNSGSRGFSRIDSPEELTQELFDRAVKNGTTGSAIIEELLIPVATEIAEQSVETLWHEGAMYWLNWVDRLFRKDLDSFPGAWEGGENPYENISWAVELGHINPAIHDSRMRQEVEDVVRRAGEALGMGKEKGSHILKADIMLTTRGPMILELTPRLSGGWDSSYTTPARGADFAAGMLDLALGEALTLEYWQRYFAYKDPMRYAAVLTEVDMGAQDCIGRRFAAGTGYERLEAMRAAREALARKAFLI